MIKGKLLKRFIPLVKYLIPLRLPSIIAIESSNRCFLNCITCPIPTQMKRQKGDMSLSTFRLLLSQINWKINKLNWAFGGEPLLNKDIWQMVKLASESGIYSRIDTNGILLNQFEEEIFTSNLRVLNIVFEGFSKESTTTFRQGYDYEHVIRNIKGISKIKQRIGAKYPVIGLNFLVKKDNENEIEATLEFARKLKLDYVTLKSINICPSDWLSEEYVQAIGDKYLPVKRIDLCRYEKKDGRWVPKEILNDFCRYLLDSVTITWDGKVLPCCFDYDASMIVGNIHSEDLKTIWRNKRFSDIRNRIFGNSLSICNNCTSVSLQEKIVLGD
ncbi:MAG: radical SAM protein [Candidatus Omnitrophica bacterium]|nr:radical SAM protein [Candidatus Omnitrophota bacterium]